MNKLIKTMVISIAALGLSACVTLDDFDLNNGNTQKPNIENQDSVATYQCGSDTVSATFLNENGRSIALVSVNGESKKILSNVVSGSGAKYQGDIYQLWTKGDNAIFTNLLKAPNDDIQCKKL